MSSRALITLSLVASSASAEPCREPLYPICATIHDTFNTSLPEQQRLFQECRDELERYDQAIDVFENCITLEAAQTIRRAKERREGVHQAWGCLEAGTFFMFCVSPDQPKLD